MERRLRKLEAIREDISDHEVSPQTYYGPNNATYDILTYGSQQGTVMEAVARLNGEGHSVKALGVSQLKPFPDKEVTQFLESVDSALVVEMNATSQFRGLLQKELGRFGPKLSSLLKYNGNPFEPADIVEGFEAGMTGEEFDNQAMRYEPTASD